MKINEEREMHFQPVISDPQKEKRKKNYKFIPCISSLWFLKKNRGIHANTFFMLGTSKREPLIFIFIFFFFGIRDPLILIFFILLGIRDPLITPGQCRSPSCRFCINLYLLMPQVEFMHNWTLVRAFIMDDLRFSSNFEK